MHNKCKEILDKLQMEHSITISSYTFPPKQELKLRLKDMLEDEVDEKYYLSDKMINYCMGVNQKESKFPRKKRFLQTLDKTNNEDIAVTITTNAGSRAVDNFILIKEATKVGYKKAYEGDGVNISSRMKYQRGNVQKESIQTITTSGGSDRGVVLNDLRIRKLTPKEVWRLMGFSDDDFEKASKVNSNTQLYKQAGNSIVVNVLEEIFKELL